jgi:nitroreductase
MKRNERKNQVKEKVAQTDYPIHDLLRRRWSPRAFASRSIPRQELCRLFEAARWAPSSNNEQPWNFILGIKARDATYDQLFSCLNPGNQLWAGQAPVLMLSVASLLFSDDQSPNRHAFHDVGLAVENLSVQAMSMDIFVHQMAGFQPDKARELFGIPKDHDPVAMIALGYLGDPATLPEKLRARELTPRTRKPLEEFVFEPRWGASAAVLSAGSGDDAARTER